MKIILQENQKYMLRFDRGEELIEGLRKFCQAKKIEAGFFFGLGAVQEVLISFYDIDRKVYQGKNIKQKLEIVSLLGNIAKMGKETIIHAHGIFSDAKMKSWGGHVKKLIISATAEVFLQTLKGKIERQYNQGIGLNLIK